MAFKSPEEVRLNELVKSGVVRSVNFHCSPGQQDAIFEIFGLIEKEGKMMPIAACGHTLKAAVDSLERQIKAVTKAH